MSSTACAVSEGAGLAPGGLAQRHCGIGSGTTTMGRRSATSPYQENPP